MITLEYRISEQVFLSDLASDPDNADAGVLEETYFVCPVRFCIDGRELLAHSTDGDPWRDLPLLGMAWGIRAISTLPPGEDFRLYLAGGGHLDVQSKNDSVIIVNSLTGTQACAARSELKYTAMDFLQRLRETFETSAPRLRNHRAWSAWFG